MSLKISPNTLGLMAATILPVIETYDLESILFRGNFRAYGEARDKTMKDIALQKTAELVCDMAKAIEDELDRRAGELT